MNKKAPAPGRHRTLAEAQEYLLARRAALRLAREGNHDSSSSCDPAHPPYPGQQKTENRKRKTGNRKRDSQLLTEAVASLPDHLGWGSAAQTAVLRAAAKQRSKKCQPKTRPTLSRIKAAQPAGDLEPAAQTEPRLSAEGTVSLAPSLGLAILRHKKAAPSRLWLLLRAVDTNGRGAVALDLARKAFTDTESPLHFCGKRQLRNLLAAGDGLFWHVDEQKIWLRSATRLAQALDVARFRGQDVALPISALTGGIGAVRANLFAAFHSGRDSKPLSRQTLARRSGVAQRTQRQYDRLSGVTRQTNYVRGPQLGSKEAQEQAWQQGPASFVWREKRKGQNRREGRFLAWQLPNSYHGPHARLGRGRQKRQNKALADLLNKGTAGNDHSQYDDLAARYFADARAASRAHGRTNSAVYWPAIKPGIWHCLWLPGNEGTANRSKSSAGGRQK